MRRQDLTHQKTKTKTPGRQRQECDSRKADKEVRMLGGWGDGCKRGVCTKKSDGKSQNNDQEKIKAKN